MSDYINLTDHPNSDPSDNGELINYGYGTLKSVKGQAIVSGASTLLTGAIDDSTTTVTVTDSTRFPATPFIIQIGYERMNVTNKASNVFTVTRGYDSTLAEAHGLNEVVFQVLTEYVYLFNKIPNDGFDAVYIDGTKQLAANYTAYTGQSGDEHTDWPDQAVVAFTADGYIGQQYNITEAGLIAAGETVVAEIDTVSDHRFRDETFNTSVFLGQSGRPGNSRHEIWATFAPNNGVILTQTYGYSAANLNAVTPAGNRKPIEYDVIVREGDNLIKREHIFNTGFTGGSPLPEITLSGGSWDDTLAILNTSGKLLVAALSKTVIRRQEGAVLSNVETVIEVGQEDSHLNNGPVRWQSYADTAHGDTIVKQRHKVKVQASSSKEQQWRLLAVNKNGTVVASELVIETATFETEWYLEHDAGDWDTMTVLVDLNGAPAKYMTSVRLSKEITYTTAGVESTNILPVSSSARVVVGSNITADIRGAVDTTGDYGGSGNLIERPDWVIKHYLVNRRGADLADIDASSFSAAGTLYAAAISGGYTYNFLWDPSLSEDKLAEQSRSVIYVTGGKYYLDFVPDSPPAAVLTIPEGATIGPSGFIFNHGKFEELHTSFTARHGKKPDGSWSGVVTAVDGGNKYGTREKTIDLSLVTDPVMAQDVLDNILLQAQALYKNIIFTTSWKYQSLQIGDTFDIESELHTGTKFFIEKLRINGNNTVTIEAKQWW